MRRNRGWRKLHLAGVEYCYRIGKNYIPVRGPDRKVVMLQLTDVAGMDFATIERAKWKNYFHITPSQIKSALMLQLSLVVSK